MDLKSLLSNPKQRIIFLVVLLVLIGLIGGYYVVTNYILVPSEETVVTTPRRVTSIETYTLAQLLETLTRQTSVVFTYSRVELGRSNPFIPVIDLTPKKKISQVPQSTPSNVNITVTPKAPLESTKTWYSNFRLTGIVMGKDRRYAIIEEGDRGYVLREGEFLKNDIYVSKISDSSVVLKRGNAYATLKLGGE